MELDISSADLYLKEVKEFKQLVVKTFDAHCNQVICILMFYLLCHALMDFERFRSWEMLDSSQFERFNVHIILTYMKRSLWKSTSM